MANKSMYYVSVSCDMQPDGFNLACWLSTEDIWKGEEQKYPFAMKCQGEAFSFWVHSSCELTVKARRMIAEEAEKMLLRQIDINSRRKLANR